MSGPEKPSESEFSLWLIEVTQAVKSLHQNLEEFRKLEPQRDDITILGLSVG